MAPRRSATTDAQLDAQIALDAATPDCPECGHRALAHRLGNEPCAMPGCPCPIGRNGPS